MTCVYIQIECRVWVGMLSVLTATSPDAKRAVLFAGHDSDTV